MPDSIQSLSDCLQRIANVATGNVARAIENFNESSSGPKAGIAGIVSTTPSSLVPGKPDRIWTGQMRDTGSGRVRSYPDMIMYDFGWLDNPPSYIATQEFGGEAFGVEIEPMNALQQLAIEYINGSLNEHIREAVVATLRGKKM